MTTNSPPSDLPWTGERYVPQLGGELGLEHLHRYHWAAQFAGGKRVLDIACGEGYGSEILARCAAHVIGVDLSEETVAHAIRRYQLDNLEFLVGSCDQVPIPDKSIDLVVSFETIEHHDRHQEMVREIKRILCQGGILIVSTPDKYVCSRIPDYKNEFHVKELYVHEFKSLLREYFTTVEMFGQRIAYGSIIAGKRASGMVCLDSGQKSPLAIRGIERAIYNVAIATDGPPPDTFSSIYELNVTNSAAYQSLLHAYTEARRDAENLNDQCSFKRQECDALRRGIVQSGDKVARLEAEIEHLKVTRFEAKRECHSMKTSLSWRLTWPLRILRDKAVALRGRIAALAAHRSHP